MTLPYKGDIGAVITISTQNLIIPSGATVTFALKKPTTGTVLTKSPSVNLATGVLTYDTITGDLDESGEFRVQVHMVSPDGDDVRSDVDSFTVFEPLV